MGIKNVIRVFLSSTFVDMKEERRLFNTVIVPKLKRLCANRGVSFFGVDLRWGITKEAQEEGRVLPICLGEVDNCRPFFLGILGNRYGSEVETITPEQEEVFPWLKGRAGRSVTELEMLYGVLEPPRDERGHSAFLFRSDRLSAAIEKKLGVPPEPEEKREKVERLKKKVRETEDVPHYTYDTLEEFEKQVTDAFQIWLDREFPGVEDAVRARKEWYDRELTRNFIEATPGMISALNGQPSILDMYLETSKSPYLLIESPSKTGKTTYLTRWKPEEGHKCLINCGAMEAYRDWPALAGEIVSRLKDLDRSGKAVPEWDGREESLEAFREAFVAWLGEVKAGERVYLVINDVNLLENGKGMDLIVWLSGLRDKNVHVICTANRPEFKEKAEEMGWEYEDFPELESDDDGVAFFKGYIKNFGKDISGKIEKELKASQFIRHPGYLKFIGNYLVKYADFEDLKRKGDEIARKKDAADLYRYVWNKMAKHWELTEQEGKLAQRAFYILSVTELGLYEDELYSLTFPRQTENQSLVWARIRIMLDQFEAIGDELWKIDDPVLANVAKGFRVDPGEVCRRLGDHFQAKAAQAEGRQKRRYAEAAERQYKKAASAEKTKS